MATARYPLGIRTAIASRETGGFFGASDEPTQKRDSKIDQAPGDATQTAASRAYHSSENRGGIAEGEVSIQVAKYGIIVLAFVGEFQHQRTLVSPTPTEMGMKVRQLNPMKKTCKFNRRFPCLLGIANVVAFTPGGNVSRE